MTDSRREGLAIGRQEVDRDGARHDVVKVLSPPRVITARGKMPPAVFSSANNVRGNGG